MLRNLIAHGFNGAVYPVHPTAHSIASVRAWPSVLDVPDDIDLAVIVVPAGEVVKVVEQCARKRVRGLVVLAAGFAEVDEAGARDEAEIVSIAHRHGMRVLGPASMGVISTVPDVSMHASFAPVTLIPGRVAFSSQSVRSASRCSSKRTVPGSASPTSSRWATRRTSAPTTSSSTGKVTSRRR